MYMYIVRYVPICIHIYIYIYVHTYVHIYIYIHMCVYVYTHAKLTIPRQEAGLDLREVYARHLGHAFAILS